MQVRNRRDFVVGLGYFFAGATFALAARGYERGTADQMGPGYFPFWLGIVLAVLGAVVTLRALGRTAPRTTLAAWDWRALAWITGSVVLFALALQPLGLALSLAGLVVLASLASREFTWKGTLANAVFLVALNLGVFVFGLDLPLPVWPALAGF